jgi:hypothetical protein
MVSTNVRYAQCVIELATAAQARNYPKISPPTPPFLNQRIKHRDVPALRPRQQQLSRNRTALTASNNTFLFEARKQSLVIFLERRSVDVIGPLGCLRCIHTNVVTPDESPRQLLTTPFKVKTHLNGRVPPFGQSKNSAPTSTSSPQAEKKLSLWVNGIHQLT